MLKYAIVGIGGMANVHAEKINSIEGVSVTCASPFHFQETIEGFKSPC